MYCTAVTIISEIMFKIRMYVFSSLGVLGNACYNGSCTY